jgi:hypothetical protein
VHDDCPLQIVQRQTHIEGALLGFQLCPGRRCGHPSFEQSSKQEALSLSLGKVLRQVWNLKPWRQSLNVVDREGLGLAPRKSLHMDHCDSLIASI